MDPTAKVELLTVPAYGIFAILVIREVLAFVGRRGEKNGNGHATRCCAERVGAEFAAGQGALLVEVRGVRAETGQIAHALNNARQTQAAYVQTVDGVCETVADIHRDLAVVGTTVNAALAHSQQNGKAIETVQRNVEVLVQRGGRP